MSIGEYFNFVFSHTVDMFNIVENEGHGSVWLVFVIGIVFGAIIQYSRVDKFEKIAGFAMGKDTIIPKMLFLAIGITAIFLYFEIKMGYASYHVKPMTLMGLIIGGTIFGVGMAIMGKCPGTGPISIAEGRVDVAVGAVGGLFAGWIFTKYYDDFFKPLMGENYGNTTLVDVSGDNAALFVLLFGAALIVIAIVIPKMELFDGDDLEQLPESERPDIKAKKENESFEVVK
jgi:uncharacterized membrane protein YedE/YeeE